MRLRARMSVDARPLPAAGARPRGRQELEAAAFEAARAGVHAGHSAGGAVGALSAALRHPAAARRPGVCHGVEGLEGWGARGPELREPWGG